MTDPIGDLLTRIRNASAANQLECAIPHSRLKASVVDILVKEGFLAGAAEGQDARGHKALMVRLKYVDGQPAITGLTRVSKPGRRLYAGTAEFPRVVNGLGMSILSTSKGVMKDGDARRQKVGGEILCTVW